MTISSTVRKAGPYVGNGSATSFAFAFKVFSASDVVVTLSVVATGVETLLVLNSDYTVTLNADQNNNPGGTVTYNPSGTPMPSTKTLTLTSSVAESQGTEIPNAGGFYPEVIENALDKVTVLVQQMSEVLSRCFRLPVSGNGNPTLPQTPNAGFGWNATADAIVSYVFQAGTSLVDLAAQTGSALIGFIQSGTGAVKRTLQSKERDVVCAFDFMTSAEIAAVNARASAVDVTAALQAAYDSLTSGGTLMLPPGVYKTSDQLTVSYGVRTLGAGRGSTTINATVVGANKSALKAINNNAGFSNFTLVGPSAAAYVSEENGIYLYGTSGAKKSKGIVENVEVYNFGNAGILVEYYNDVTVTGCCVHDCGYIGIAGFSVEDMTASSNNVATITPGTAGNNYGITFSARAAASECARFVADGNTIKSIAWEGIDTHGGTDGVISNNTIADCLYGINVSPSNAGAHAASARVVISGNTLTGVAGSYGRGIGSGGYDASNPAIGINVTGNTLKGFGFTSSYTDGAMMFQFTENLVICGNNIIDSVATGLGLISGNLGFAVTGNNIRTVQAGHANASGIVINSASQTGIITGNNIETVAGKYGIYTVSANKGICVFGNKIVATGALLLDAVNLGTGTRLTAGSTTTDVGSIASLGSDVVTISVSGAEVGDFVTCSSTLGDTAGLNFVPVVTATHTVKLRLNNSSGGAIDPASATYSAFVTKA